MEKAGYIICKIKHRLQGNEGPFYLDINLDIQKGEVLAITGESGVGKTSLIRILAGLQKAEQGFVSVAGKTWLDTEHKLSLSTQKRTAGMVFQDYALFPHMSVIENLHFALAKDDDTSWPETLLKRVGLWELRTSLPAKLSGGQQQRVAILRALIQKPDLLLLDEPLSALDESLRRQLQQEILQIQQELGFSIIWISHNLMEICSIADRVMILEQGKIKVIGSPEDVFMPKVQEKWQGIILKKLGDQEYWVQVGNSPYRLKFSGNWAPGDTIFIQPQILASDEANNS